MGGWAKWPRLESRRYSHHTRHASRSRAYQKFQIPQRTESNNMSRLYVGNLSYSTTDASLRSFFETAGEVAEAEVVIDRATGRSKGFGFVTMANAEGAQNAIDTLNGRPLDNREIRIDFAKPKEDRPRVGGGGYSGGGGGYGGGDRRGGGGGGYGGGGRGGDRRGDRGDRRSRFDE
jgi:RNA recognition motif-containing protein